MKALRIFAKNIRMVSMYVTVLSMSHFSSLVMAFGGGADKRQTLFCFIQFRTPMIFSSGHQWFSVQDTDDARKTCAIIMTFG